VADKNLPAKLGLSILGAEGAKGWRNKNSGKGLVTTVVAAPGAQMSEAGRV
jgi:hypothetical protein